MRYLTLAFIALTMVAGTAQARDTVQKFSIQEALNTADAKTKLDPSIKFYFGNQSHPAVTKTYGNFQTNKKTNAFGKSDKEACEWVFLSAMLQFQERVQSLGGNAVINIKSNYKQQELASNTEYECGAGFLMAGVTFTGDVVKLAR